MPRTLFLHADPLDPARQEAAIEKAADILRSGGTVAFPTETVYGLGANALDPSAVAKIFGAKQRPAWDPLIVHVADEGMLHNVVTAIPEPARLWLVRFTPGPLTLLLPRTASVPDAVTAGRALVGIRVPAHPVARALLRAAGLPVAAPSANLFGHVSPTTAAHVLADLDGRIDAVLDGGACEHGVESTVVDACSSPCIVYRPGAVTLEQLQEVWPDVAFHRAESVATADSGTPASLPSPGVGLRHYAPRARLLLVEHGPGQAERLLETVLAQKNRRIALLLPEGLLTPNLAARLPEQVLLFTWGQWNAPAELAHRLFLGLRTLDDRGAERIVCPLPLEDGLGAALCDRLRKAARPA